jgi:hypothetical protein
MFTTTTTTTRCVRVRGEHATDINLFHNRAHRRVVKNDG